MKRFFAVIFMLFALVIPCFAAGPTIESEEVFRETLSDGTIVESVFTVYNSSARATGKSADYTKTFWDSNRNKMAVVTLYVDFSYDGTEAWIRSSYTDVTEYNGWTYGSERIRESGGTAKLTAKISKSGQTDRNVSMSISCSPNGVLTKN